MTDLAIKPHTLDELWQHHQAAVARITRLEEGLAKAKKELEHLDPSSRYRDWVPPALRHEGRVSYPEDPVVEPEPETWDIQFWVTLLRLDHARALTAAGQVVMEANCTHVTGPYWIMEGDINYLTGQGISFKEIAQGAVGSLGDLSEDELKQVCLDSFGVKL